MKRKGFTLIELLAVIIVLAIIALIATPIIFNVIENAKIKALENSSYGVIDAVRTRYAENLLNSSDGTVKLTGEVKDLMVAGEQPIAGTWTIDNTKNSDERGIKIVGVKFASMNNYTCSNVDENDKITSKVACEKDEPDEVVPTISAKQVTVEVGKGTDEKIKNYFNVTFGKTGGNITCEVENVSELTEGDHTVKCTATGTNGKTAEATIKIIISNKISLKSAILGNNNSNVLANGEDQTWITAWQTSDSSGLYSQTVGSNKTYYFRGQPTNNYIKFAGKDFRILRVNEDGTIRIMLSPALTGIENKAFNDISNTYDKMYYTNSELKTVVDDWFTTNITGNDASKVVSGNYFCEQAKVVYDTNFTAGNATVATSDKYTPSFNCATDGNGKGVVSGKVGLITIDEILYAGGIIRGWSAFYLDWGGYNWTMSPAGFSNNDNRAYVWDVVDGGGAYDNSVLDTVAVLPVINLKANTTVTGSGTSTDPYIVE